MGITQPPPPGRPSARTGGTAVSVCAYVMLFLLGLAEGVLGSFQYSRAVLGGVPIAAIGFALGILVTCALAGWAMRSMLGALLPAIGWFVGSFVLAMPDSNGSVIIANTTAGEWYLYAGSVCALAGVGSAFFTAPRRVTSDARADAGTGAGTGSGTGTGTGTGAGSGRNGPGA